MKTFSYFLAAVGGTLAVYFKAYIPLIAIFAIAVTLDFITGIVAAFFTGVGLSSDKARKGAIKKGMMLLSLLFGIFLDFLIPFAAEQIGMDMSVKLMFSTIITLYIVFTECVSVCENIYKCTPEAFPAWIVKMLADGKETLEKLKETDKGDEV